MRSTTILERNSPLSEKSDLPQKLDGISVVYPTVGRPQLLISSICALLGNTVLPDEIIVVDQSRTDKTRLALASLNEPRLIHIPSNEKGLSNARNTGIQKSHFPIIGFIDDDCIPARNWIESAKNAIRRAPSSSVWIGEVYDSEAEIAEAAFVNCNEYLIDVKGIDDPWRIGPTGGNSFFRKCTFDLVGVFDPLLGQGSQFPGAEDGDMIYRIFKHGIQVTCTNAIRVYHIGWRNDKENIGNSYNYGMGVGAMIAKYYKQGDYYPLAIIFTRRFLNKYFMAPCYLILAQEKRFWHSFKWSQGIMHGFVRWKHSSKKR